MTRGIPNFPGPFDMKLIVEDERDTRRTMQLLLMRGDLDGSLLSRLLLVCARKLEQLVDLSDYSMAQWAGT